MEYEVSRRSFLKGAAALAVATAASGLLTACGGARMMPVLQLVIIEFPVVLLSIGMLIARAVIRLKQQLRLPKQALRVGLTGSMSSRTRNTMISSALKI